MFCCWVLFLTQQKMRDHFFFLVKALMVLKLGLLLDQNNWCFFPFWSVTASSAVILMFLNIPHSFLYCLEFPVLFWSLYFLRDRVFEIFFKNNLHCPLYVYFFLIPYNRSNYKITQTYKDIKTKKKKKGKMGGGWVGIPLISCVWERGSKVMRCCWKGSPGRSLFR